MVTTDEQARRQRMGHQVKEARITRGWSQAELAALVEDVLAGEETLDQSMISRYENGRAVPEPPKRRALEKLLGLTPGDLQRTLEPELDLYQPDPAATVAARLERIEDNVAALMQAVNGLADPLLRVLKQLESEEPADR